MAQMHMKILIEKEIQLHKFEIRTNETEVSKLLHSEFLEVGKSGRTFDYQTIVKSMVLEKPTESVVHSQEYECIQLAENVCLLLYKSAVIMENGAVGGFAKRSSVWIKDKLEWKLRYHQGTPCDEFQLSK
jgi:hypothetical protein